MRLCGSEKRKNYPRAEGEFLMIFLGFLLDKIQCTPHGISIYILIFSKTNNSTTSMGLLFSSVSSPFRWTFYVTAHPLK